MYDCIWPRLLRSSLSAFLTITNQCKDTRVFSQSNTPCWLLSYWSLTTIVLNRLLISLCSFKFNNVLEINYWSFWAKTQSRVSVSSAFKAYVKTVASDFVNFWPFELTDVSFDSRFSKSWSCKIYKFVEMSCLLCKIPFTLAFPSCSIPITS